MNAALKFRPAVAVIFTIAAIAATVEVAVADDMLDDVRVAFELTSRDGKIVRYEGFRGKYALLAFGFTHCAHICPMIAANMSRVLKASDKDAVGIFISVDTERDSPAITDDYARRFGESMVGLSGTYAQVSAAAKNFNVTFVVTKSEDNYTVQHTPSIFLIGPDGGLIDVYALNTPTDVIERAMH